MHTKRACCAPTKKLTQAVNPKIQPSKVTVLQK